MDCVHRRYRTGEVLCAEPDVLVSNDDRPKVVRCEEHCVPGLCGDFISYEMLRQRTRTEEPHV